MLGLIVFGVLLLGGAAYRFMTARTKTLQGRIAAAEADRGAAQDRTAAEKAEKKAREAAAVVALGFVAEEDLDTEQAQPAPPERTAAIAAVRSGDWEAGASYVEAAGSDWEERWQRVRALAEVAAEDDAWLLAWHAARPSDPTAALVDADTAVQVAWNVRGSQAGSRTTQEQFRLFHELLVKAQAAAHEAQRLADPADPVPYMVEQPIAQGLGYPHDRYEKLWAEITGRDPRILTAHTTALQYWCQKWRGSHELALAFAHASAASGAPGELLSLLPLVAYVEQELHEQELTPETFFKEPGPRAAVDAALMDLAAADPADRRAVRLRHVLAWLLFWQDRDAEAVEQFRVIDGYIGALPWYYSGTPKGRYLYARNWAVLATTAEHGA
ncbi:hypothetical protein CP980_12765 [Streptomyces vinaceus]|uniref:DUF4034 domain-containing protein n=1 Tax=Streptomyces vinaceus TaxID=1960 RepID=A0A5J6JDK5_STRVI|nr:hypothetical protein [Streptomyces vinaceus]QEV45846.1 hypothetical protein CP980_12765 [Streptomyces vinaceus]GHE33815.1 hypothetical protein GCM10017778_16050 [Streptomyces vinaceus]